MDDSFYCQIESCVGVHDIKDWNALYWAATDLGLSEDAMKTILNQERCQTQCPDCACIVGEQRLKTQELIKKMQHG